MSTLDGTSERSVELGRAALVGQLVVQVATIEHEWTACELGPGEIADDICHSLLVVGLDQPNAWFVCEVAPVLASRRGS